MPSQRHNSSSLKEREFSGPSGGIGEIGGIGGIGIGGIGGSPE
jgi:hypothetical protein